MSLPPDPLASIPSRSKRLGGLLVRRERWSLSWPATILGWLLLLGLVLLAGRSLCSFLSVSRPVHSEFLVLEGWLPPSSLWQAAEMIKTGHYRKVLTSGGPAGDEWGTSPTDTYAELAARRLVKLGIPGDLIQAVPSTVGRKDRTYFSAVAVQAWVQDHHLQVNSLDVVTEGPHARRSRLLYEKAFGGGVEIGVISVQDPKYDPARWWRSSEGVKEVMSEAIAYSYARVFFHPPRPPASQ